MVSHRFVLVLLIAIILLSSLSSVQAQGPTFGNAIKLNNGHDGTERPRVAVSGSNVYAVWTDVKPTPKGNALSIVFSASADSGSRFSNPVQLNKESNSSTFPDIAAAGANVYVVWMDKSLGNSEIFIRESTNNGASFGAIVNLSQDPGTSSVPTITATGTNVYVAWEDNSLGNTQIFFRASPNGGLSFNPTMSLSPNIGESSLRQDIFTSHKLSTLGSMVYIVWQYTAPGASADILFRASSDNGNTFGPILNLSNNPGNSHVPQITACGHSVYVTWQDHTPGNASAFFIASTNNGTSFGPIINLSNTTNASTDQQVACSGSSSCVAWSEDTDNDGIVDQIFFRKSSDNGTTFNPKINLSNSTGFSTFPLLVASTTNLLVVWQIAPVTRSTSSIVARASPDMGTTFGPTITLTNPLGSSSNEEVIVVGNSIYMVWQDTRTVFFLKGAFP